jgi:DNA polymerase-1
MPSRPTELPPAGAADVLYLVDFSGYVFRAYHALPALTSPTGEPTNATYGTVNMLAKLVGERKPEYLAVAIDSPGRTFREELDPRYKAHRPPAPEDLVVQLARSREIVEAYCIPVFGAAGLEADDLIAVAVQRAKAAGLRVVIASADKDLMQLVEEDGSVVMWDAMRDRVYGAPEVEAKFGVQPSQVRDWLALVGDSSDNVPGVPSVGAKTATELLNQFGSLDNLYAHVDEVKRPRTREALREHEGEARLSQRLVSLDATAPIELDLESLRYGGADRPRLHALFTELGFTRLLKSVSSTKAADKAKATLSIETVLTEAALATIAGAARAAGQLAIFVHATSAEPMRAHVSGLALAVDGASAAYVPIGHRYLGAPAQLSLDAVRRVLGPIFADPALAKLGHDLKFAEVLLGRCGMPLQGVTFDTMLASYLLDPEASHELAEAAARDANTKLPSFETIAPKRRSHAQATLDDVEIEQAAGYAAPFATAALTLAEAYRPRLVAAKLERLQRELELPLMAVLARMERTGVLVDFEALGALGTEMVRELARLEEQARAIAGSGLNLASPRQLEVVLFDELGLRSTRRTKTGRSTDAEALEAIVDDHPLPAIILEHRAVAKLKGTYVDALPRLINPETGRIHTRWNQAVAATGRISSQDPNLQNIPIRSELGKLIRRAFVAPSAPKKSVILSADYSQIELRVLAHLSNDPVLVQAFRANEDVHVRTAMEIFEVTRDEVTEDMRRKSKTVNFGVIYGMGEQALAKRLSISRAEAARFIAAYFARYHGVREFMDRTMEDARRTETVFTLLGRRRLLPDLRSSDRARRAYAERIAQNTPIQGTAADLLKLAMVKLAEPVVEGARMVLTVHDELAFEVPEDRVEEAAAKVRAAMEGVYPLSVPLLVEVGWGASWAEAH